MSNTELIEAVYETELLGIVHRIMLGKAKASAGRSPDFLRRALAQIDDASTLAKIAGKIGESKTCALFDHMIRSDTGFPELWPDVTMVKSEHILPCGRVDRLLRHADGSFTLVEIKPPGSRRDQCQGLGQVIMYAASFRACLGDNTEVRAALFIGADEDAEMRNACDSVGVTYLTMHPMVQEILVELSEAYNRGMNRG